VLPADERLAVERHLREFDRIAEDLRVIERDLARSALEDEGVKRLMTIPGVYMVVALAIVAAIGEWDASTDRKSFSAISASTRACGSRATQPAYHGRITKRAAAIGPIHDGATETKLPVSQRWQKSR
jgi:transposase